MNTWRTAMAIPFLVGAMGCSVSMPGRSHSGPLPEQTGAQRELAARLQADVTTLAGDIGQRNVSHPKGLAEAEEFLRGELQKAGYTVTAQTFRVDGVPCSNLVAELRGTESPDDILVVGAHYDSVHECPAANDNGSGVAATLALARAFADAPRERTIRFVLFVNEEPPYFWSKDMGSLVYARSCRAAGERVVGMLSLETIGYYRDEPGTQKYPPPFSLLYPSEGNFIAFVGNTRSRELVRSCVGAFREHAAFPSEGAALPIVVPRIGASDHSSFWRCGYPALMVTDTANFRYPHYHKLSDTPDRIDYGRMARVVEGLGPVVDRLARAGPR